MNKQVRNCPATAHCVRSYTHHYSNISVFQWFITMLMFLKDIFDPLFGRKTSHHCNGSSDLIEMFVRMHSLWSNTCRRLRWKKIHVILIILELPVARTLHMARCRHGWDHGLVPSSLLCRKHVNVLDSCLCREQVQPQLKEHKDCRWDV